MVRWIPEKEVKEDGQTAFSIGTPPANVSSVISLGYKSAGVLPAVKRKPSNDYSEIPTAFSSLKS